MSGHNMERHSHSSTTCKVKTAAYFKTSTYPFAAATWSDVPPDLACRTSWIWPLLSHCRASLSMTRSSSFLAASMSTPEEWQRRPTLLEWHWRITCYLLPSCLLYHWTQRMEEGEHMKVFIRKCTCLIERKECECLGFISLHVLVLSIGKIYITLF